MALPYINLFIGDVKKDTDLLSPAAFGAYMRLLFFGLHGAKPNRGEASFTVGQLVKIFGAEDREEALSLVAEITNPQFEIVDYQQDEAGLHFFRNRRMVKESQLKEKRSAAGKKGAETTNKRFAVAGQFDAANDAANRAANESDCRDFAEGLPGGGATNFSSSERVFNGVSVETPLNDSFVAANDAANNTTKTPANAGNGIGINNGYVKEEEKGVEGEKEEGNPVFKGVSIYIIPEMLAVFKQYKPKYIFQQEKDMPALRKIADTIAQAEGITYQTPDGVDRVKEIWEGIVAFAMKDPLYKDFQISQVEKYLQAITNKLASSLDAPVKQPAPAASTIENNLNTAHGARELLRRRANQQAN